MRHRRLLAASWEGMKKGSGGCYNADGMALQPQYRKLKYAVQNVPDWAALQQL